jgi:ADP-ribose pyrophosphatase YjhB (NUDIX family)
MKSFNFCNNCGKVGHLFHQCKMPIISIGIIAFRKMPSTMDEKLDMSNSNNNSISNNNSNLEYLLIRRKHSLGFVDFMRGKYQMNNKEYILSLINKMNMEERKKIIEQEFDELWDYLWGENVGIQYRSEEKISQEKYNTLKSGVFNKVQYDMKSLVEECNEIYEESEWGFPKGRRNYQEKDLTCALREFEEETGYSRNDITIVQNLMPLEEIYTGSNFKSYKHKYFLAYIESDIRPTKSFQKTEVSKVEWKSFDNCMSSIRKYNLEKFDLLERVNMILSRYKLYS